MNSIEAGRILRGGTTGFVVGCRVSQISSPSFGALIMAPLDDDYQIYGLIQDIHIDDDGLVRQLVTAEGIEESIIADNRQNRNVPIEMNVITVGYKEGGVIFHLLPPHPPLSLHRIYLCTSDEICEFTDAGKFGYFRHILRSQESPVAELLSAHIKQANAAHTSAGNTGWYEAATREIIWQLRDDYQTLMSVLGAISDI